MSELESYNLIKSAMKQAEKLGFKLTYKSDHWELDGNRVLERGATARELHMYLNGYQDGRAAATKVPLE